MLAMESKSEKIHSYVFLKLYRNTIFVIPKPYLIIRSCTDKTYTFNITHFNISIAKWFMGIKVYICTRAFSFFLQKCFPFDFAMIKAKPSY